MVLPCSVLGKRIRLQQLDLSLMESYLQSFSPTVAHILHTTCAAERSYIQRVLASERLRTWFYCIIDQKSNQVIGAIAICPDGEEKGFLYHWIHESQWGHGYCQESMALMIAIYFNETGFSLVHAHVDVTNRRSYSALTKSGFVPYGLRAGPYGQQHHLILRKK